MIGNSLEVSWGPLDVHGGVSVDINDSHWEASGYLGQEVKVIVGPLGFKVLVTEGSEESGKSLRALLSAR